MERITFAELPIPKRVEVVRIRKGRTDEEGTRITAAVRIYGPFYAGAGTRRTAKGIWAGGEFTWRRIEQLTPAQAIPYIEDAIQEELERRGE